MAIYEIWKREFRVEDSYLEDTIESINARAALKKKGLTVTRFGEDYWGDWADNSNQENGEIEYPYYEACAPQFTESIPKQKELF
jgi:hypothetical protein